MSAPRIVTPPVPYLVANTARSFTVTVTSPTGSPDLTACSGAHLIVHRALPPRYPGGVLPPETIETWTATVASVPTPTSVSLTLTVPLLGATPGTQAVTTPGESLRLRPMLSFAASPDVEVGQFALTVVEQ